MEKESPRTLQELMRRITPPKGVHGKAKDDDASPWDEGLELFDCEGDEILDDSLPEESDEEEEEQFNRNEEPADDALTASTSNERSGPIPSSCEGEEKQETTDIKQQYVNGLVDKFPHLREDLLFLHELEKVIEIKGAQTSLLFMPYMIQLKTTYRNARLNLRKCMVQSTTEDNNRC